MRILEVTPEQQDRVNDLLGYVLRKENWYRPGRSFVPGDRPEYTIHLNDYRCVFSITIGSDGSAWKHLSVSVPLPGKFPNEIAMCEIARMFGFTGAKVQTGIAIAPGDDWAIDVNREYNCVVILQPHLPSAC